MDYYNHSRQDFHFDQLEKDVHTNEYVLRDRNQHCIERIMIEKHLDMKHNYQRMLEIVDYLNRMDDDLLR